jgi:hypothetical protein
MAFLSQSGAMCTAVLDLSIKENIGFSDVVSLGDMLDVDFGDMIDYLGGETDVSSIVMYVESLTNFRKFMEAINRGRIIAFSEISDRQGKHTDVINIPGNLAEYMQDALVGEDPDLYEGFYSTWINTYAQHFDMENLLYDSQENMEAFVNGQMLALGIHSGGIPKDIKHLEEGMKAVIENLYVDEDQDDISILFGHSSVSNYMDEMIKRSQFELFFQYPTSLYQKGLPKNARAILVDSTIRTLTAKGIDDIDGNQKGMLDQTYFIPVVDDYGFKAPNPIHEMFKLGFSSAYATMIEQERQTDKGSK